MVAVTVRARARTHAHAHMHTHTHMPIHASNTQPHPIFEIAATPGTDSPPVHLEGTVLQ